MTQFVPLAHDTLSILEVCFSRSSMNYYIIVLNKVTFS